MRGNPEALGGEGERRLEGTSAGETSELPKERAWGRRGTGTAGAGVQEMRFGLPPRTSGEKALPWVRIYSLIPRLRRPQHCPTLPTTKIARAPVCFSHPLAAVQIDSVLIGQRLGSRWWPEKPLGPAQPWERVGIPSQPEIHAPRGRVKPGGAGRL